MHSGGSPAVWAPSASVSASSDPHAGSSASVTPASSAGGGGGGSRAWEMDALRAAASRGRIRTDAPMSAATAAGPTESASGRTVPSNRAAATAASKSGEPRDTVLAWTESMAGVAASRPSSDEAAPFCSSAYRMGTSGAPSRRRRTEAEPSETAVSASCVREASRASRPEHATTSSAPPASASATASSGAVARSRSPACSATCCGAAAGSECRETSICTAPMADIQRAQSDAEAAVACSAHRSARPDDSAYRVRSSKAAGPVCTNWCRLMSTRDGGAESPGRAYKRSDRRSSTKHGPSRASSSRPANVRRTVSSRCPLRSAGGGSAANGSSRLIVSWMSGGSSASDTRARRGERARAASSSGTDRAAGCNRTDTRRLSSTDATRGMAAWLGVLSSVAATSEGGDAHTLPPRSRIPRPSACSVSGTWAPSPRTAAGSKLRSVDATSTPRSMRTLRRSSASSSSATTSALASSSLDSTLARCSASTSGRISASTYSSIALRAQLEAETPDAPPSPLASFSAMFAAERSAADRPSRPTTAAKARRAAPRSPRALAACPTRISTSLSASAGEAAGGAGGGGGGESGGGSSSTADGALTSRCTRTLRPRHHVAACFCSSSAAAWMAGRTVDSSFAAAAHSDGGSVKKRIAVRSRGGETSSLSRPTWQRIETASPPAHSVSRPSSTHALSGRSARPPASDRATARIGRQGVARSKARSEPSLTARLKPPPSPAVGRAACCSDRGCSWNRSRGGAGRSAVASPHSLTHTPRSDIRARDFA
eukprot:scaffold606_cov115-Isochrysis_galbana.AAC.6